MTSCRREHCSGSAVVRARAGTRSVNHGWADLSDRSDRRDLVHPLVPRLALTGNTAVQTIQPSATVPIEARRHFVHWTPVIAGAFVASALSLVLIAFGTSLGLAVASTAPTWRDTSPTLTVISGLYLVLTAAVSFGFGGYLAGRLRTSWDPALHREFVEFRDGSHGLVSWLRRCLRPPLRHE